MSKEDIGSWLAKQALWQVHIPPRKKIDHPHYDVTKPNEEYQFDLAHMPHDVFEGNTYRYLLTGIDVTSRYKVAKPLLTKKIKEVAFLLGAIYKKGGNFKYSEVFQCDNESEFKAEVKKLLEIHNVNNQMATRTYKHTDTAVVDVFDRELEKLLFKPMYTQELRNPTKVSKICVKNMDKIVSKINNTISSMTGMKPKDAFKQETILQDKTYPKKTVLPEDDLYRYLYQPREHHGDKKEEQQTLSGVKMSIV